MNTVLTVVTGSMPKSFMNEAGIEENYYRVTALGSDNKSYSFRCASKPEPQSVAVIDSYGVGDKLWDGTASERAFNVCSQLTTADTLRSAKALAAELSDIIL